MKSTSWLKLPLVVGIVAMGAGCATSHAQAPAGVPVHSLVSDRLVVRGTAAPTLANPACSGSAPAKPEHVIAIEQDTRATILLGPVPGDGPLPIAMLHITRLDTNKTWCVMTSADGTPAALGAELPSGLYAVSVAEMRGFAPRRYEVKVQAQL